LLQGRSGGKTPTATRPAADINKPRPTPAWSRSRREGPDLVDVAGRQTLAFDLLGDIYAVPIEGGAAHARLRAAWNAQPLLPRRDTLAFTPTAAAWRTSG
jgi:hypothetical protein